MSARTEPARGKEIEGLVKTVDIARGTISVASRGSAVRLFRWAGNDRKVTTTSGRPAQPGELSEGLFVTLTPSPDERYVVSIRAEAPVVAGRARSIHASKRTLTLARRGRQDVALAVAEDARIVLNGKESSLVALTGGLYVRLTLSLDKTTIVVLEADRTAKQEESRCPRPRRRFGWPF